MQTMTTTRQNLAAFNIQQASAPMRHDNGQVPSRSSDAENKMQEGSIKTGWSPITKNGFFGQPISQVPSQFGKGGMRSSDASDLSSFQPSKSKTVTYTSSSENFTTV